MLPDFAQPIAELRRRGKRPDGIVIISDGDLGLHRTHPEIAVVRIREDQRPRSLEWRFLAGLDVEIATHGGPDNALERTMALVDAVLEARPAYLRVWWLDLSFVLRIFAFGKLDVRPENNWVCQGGADGMP